MAGGGSLCQDRNKTVHLCNGILGQLFTFWSPKLQPGGDCESLPYLS